MDGRTEGMTEGRTKGNTISPYATSLRRGAIISGTKYASACWYFYSNTSFCELLGTYRKAKAENT